MVTLYYFSYIRTQGWPHISNTSTDDGTDGQRTDDDDDDGTDDGTDGQTTDDGTDDDGTDDRTDRQRTDDDDGKMCKIHLKYDPINRKVHIIRIRY